MPHLIAGQTLTCLSAIRSATSDGGQTLTCLSAIRSATSDGGQTLTCLSAIRSATSDGGQTLTCLSACAVERFPFNLPWHNGIDCRLFNCRLQVSQERDLLTIGHWTRWNIFRQCYLIIQSYSTITNFIEYSVYKLALDRCALSVLILIVNLLRSPNSLNCMFPSK